MVRPASTTALAALRRSHRRAARVTVLDAALQPVAEISGTAGVSVDGRVSMDRTRDVRRVCDFALANLEGAFTPASAYDLLYWNRLVRLERGVYVTPTEVEWFTLGTFVIDTPRVDVSTRGSTVQVQGSDRLSILGGSRFTAPVTYTAGTRLYAVIQDIAVDGGFGGDLYRLDDGGKTLAADRTYAEQEERLVAIHDLARDYALEAACDPFGYLVLRPYVQPTSVAVAWDLVAGEEALILGLAKQWSKQRLYNHVVVTGEAADQSPVRGEAMVLNPAAPHYIYGGLGDRPYFLTSAMITTTGQANEAAAALLPQVGLIEERIDLPAVVVPILEEGDVVRVVEPLSRTDDRYVIDTVQMPLGAGTLRLGTKVVRPLT